MLHEENLQAYYNKEFLCITQYSRTQLLCKSNHNLKMAHIYCRNM